MLFEAREVNSTMKVSILSIITNQQQALEEKEYIKKQSISNDIELFQIDNIKNQFSSAATAYNYNAPKATGEVLIFMHQDVYLWDTEAVEKIYNFIKNEPSAIVGVAGVSSDDKKVYGDLYETKQKLRRTISCTKPHISAITLDECLFAMSSERFNAIGFDEKTTDNWHYYGADICYQNLLRGGKNYIIPLQICHESTGNQKNKSFIKATTKMIKKYKKKIDYLYTTCIAIRCTHTAHMLFNIKMYIYPIIPQSIKNTIKFIRLRKDNKKIG